SEGMFTVHQHNQPVRSKREGFDVRVVGQTGEDADFGTPVGDPSGNGEAIALLEVDADAGVLLQETLDQVRDKLSDGGDIGMQAHGTLHATRELLHLNLNVFQTVDEFAGHI